MLLPPYSLAIALEARHNQAEMSGILFDLPSLRFLRRFRFFETMMRASASPLLRWLSAPAYGSRQVHFRLDEAEFSTALQSACKLFERTLADSRAGDGGSIEAVAQFTKWKKLKVLYNLLFPREAPPPFGGGAPPQGQL